MNEFDQNNATPDFSAPQPNPEQASYTAGTPGADQGFTQTPPPEGQTGFVPPQNPSGPAQQPNYGAPGSGYQQQPNYGAPGSGYQQQPNYGAPGSGYQQQPNYGAPGSGYQQQPNYGAPGYQQQQYYPPQPNYPVYSEQKSRIGAGLLGIFLGAFGVHNFYLGYTGKAVAQLLITLLTCGAGAVVTEIWGLIEGIMILCGSISTDSQGIPLRD